MAIIKPEQLSAGLYNISGSFSGSFHGDGSDLTNLPTQSFDTGSFITTSSFNAFIGSYNTGSFTGSFIGNGSGLTNLPTQSFDTGSFILTSSFNAFTSSIYSFTSSISSSIDSLTNATSSYILNSQTSSMFVSSSVHANSSSIAISSSYALSASYASSSQSSSFATSASYTLSASYSLTSSYTQNSQTASYALQAVSSSFASTASYALNITSTIGMRVYTDDTFIAEGSKGFRHIGSNSVISKTRTLANTNGYIEVDVKRNGAVLGTISLSNQSSSIDNTLTGWTTQLNTDDLIEFYVSQSSIYITDVSIFIDIQST